jgi:cytochrome c oxidase subunit 2
VLWLKQVLQPFDRITALSFPLLPESASTFAALTDPLFWALTIFVMLFAIGVTLVLVFLGVKYRQIPGSGRKSEHIENMTLEVIWSGIPLLISICLFFWGAYIFVKVYTVPENAMEVNVIAKQWMWKMQHPNGKREVNTLHLPVDEPVKLIMTSQDVLHSFYVPAFRAKQDVLPARYTQMWFQPTKIGEYHLFCAEYCGTNHSTMGGKVIVMSRPDYEQWLEGGSALNPVDAGALLFDQNGCATCHAAGANQRGPSLENVFGHEVELSTGDVIIVDEEYVRESILNPNAKIVKGFSPLMSSFQGILSEDDIMNLIAYIKSLSDAS